MTNHRFSTASLFLLLAFASLWSVNASVQVGATNELQHDLFGPSNEQFLAGYSDDHDTMETIGTAAQDRGRASAERNYVFRVFDSPRSVSFLDANPSMGRSKSFDFDSNDRVVRLPDPSVKRNIDEIDRTAFDNFFKRNLLKIDRTNFSQFAKRLADYITNRTDRISRTQGTIRSMDLQE